MSHAMTNTQEADGDRYVNQQEAARMCSVLPQQLRRWEKHGLKPSRIGNAVRYNVAEIKQFMAANKR